MGDFRRIGVEPIHGTNSLLLSCEMVREEENNTVTSNAVLPQHTIPTVTHLDTPVVCESQVHSSADEYW